MSKKPTAPKTTAPKTTTQNTSATEAPVKPADVSAAEAAQAASQAAATEGPANQPDGSEGNLPPPGAAQGAGSESKLPELVVEAVTITSEVEGFRRAGRAWSRTPTTVQIDELSEEQLKALESEPLLQVVYVVASNEKVSA